MDGQIITTSPDPDVKKQILRELKFNKNCTSEYICQYYGAFMDKSSSTISIAMEFCEGGSLDSVYREVKKLGGRTGEKVLGKIAEGVLHGLTYLNSRKIIHRGMSKDPCLLTFPNINLRRYQTVKRPPLPQRPSQALRFRRVRRIRHQR
jgi:mitogen-activated protein kinase kinase